MTKKTAYNLLLAIVIFVVLTAAAFVLIGQTAIISLLKRIIGDH